MGYCGTERGTAVLTETGTARCTVYREVTVVGQRYSNSITLHAHSLCRAALSSANLAFVTVPRISRAASTQCTITASGSRQGRERG